MEAPAVGNGDFARRGSTDNPSGRRVETRTQFLPNDFRTEGKYTVPGNSQLETRNPKYAPARIATFVGMSKCGGC